MLAETVSNVPRPRAAAARLQAGVRTIRVGLLGLGNVGQAVARLAPEARRFDGGGLRFAIASALVRDVTRPRTCPRPQRLTTNPEAFLRGHYDVVIDALGAAEPAHSLVARLLGRGIPVVTANKALVAAHGPRLRALAARRDTWFRFEASALAGVPFLGALGARPYVAEVTRFAAILNGTSNFVLSTIDAEGCTFDRALARARALGLSEPDPSRDLDGLDAADKFVLLASILGWGNLAPHDLEVRGIRELTADDLDAARELGGTIKPIAWATRHGASVAAFVGPAFLPARNPLAALAGALSGIQLSGRYVSDLFFSGPGAGPEITAATILDDVVEAVSACRRFTVAPAGPRTACVARAPESAWLVRVGFPGVLPDDATALALLAGVGLGVLQTTRARNSAQWLQVSCCPGEHLTRGLAQLRHVHRVETYAVRAL